MIKIELFHGLPIFCKAISSDPMYLGSFLCQMVDGDIQQVKGNNIKHISSL